MATVNEALRTIRLLKGHTVGSGQCYALSAYFEHLITPDKTVGLGAGINDVSGAIGNTINAADIGSAYNWAANNWTVFVPQSANDIFVGCIINMKMYYGAPFYTGQYGHTAIVTAIDNAYITLHEQNFGGKQYVEANTYLLNQDFINGISSLVYPNGTSQTVSGQELTTGYRKLKDEQGTMTVQVAALNVRVEPSTDSEIVETYRFGDSFNYDSVYDGYGYIWVSYIGRSGIRRYVACGQSENGRNVAPFGTFM